ncbi:hypothetical protein ABZP36_012332 [Zizania latifolia]
MHLQEEDMKCPATKQVQQKDASDPPLFSVTYFNHHTCNGGSSKIVGSEAAALLSRRLRGNPCPSASARKAPPASSPHSSGHRQLASPSTGAPCSYNNQQPALSRTSLPIGQARCTEYFHFL